MPRDAELDRLKAEQDRAFTAKQNAYNTQQAAWERRATARDAMNRAFEAQNRAYEAQDAAWKEYRRVKEANGPRIDQLNAAQERAFENMKSSFASASLAYESRNGAMAASYSADGRRYKEESQGHVAERRRLVSEIRAAKERLEPYKSDFQSVKTTAANAKAIFNAAKADHERAQSAFKSAKATFDQASGAFKSRLAAVQAENNRRKNDKRSVAERAGVPYQYLDNVWVSKDSGGNTNVYFGGVGKPNGPGHGHYVMDQYGTVTYKRDPFDPHGAQNFEGPLKDGHRGGFDKSLHGWIGDSPVTFAFGWGTREGETLLANGHLTHEEFRVSRHHDHYGKGQGPNNNGTLNRRYTGPGA